MVPLIATFVGGFILASVIGLAWFGNVAEKWFR